MGSDAFTKQAWRYGVDLICNFGVDWLNDEPYRVMNYALSSSDSDSNEITSMLSKTKDLAYRE